MPTPHPLPVSDLRSLFDWRCEHSSRATAIVQLRTDGSPIAELTYADLRARVGGLAAELVRITQPGDRVLMLMPAGVSWVVTFWACVVSGRVAVPLAAPRGDRHRSGLDRLRDLAQDAGATVVCAPPDHPLQAAGAVEPGWTWFTVPDEPVPGAWPALPRPEGKAIAYLQYTSGSTGQPRGVMLSHANVLAQGEVMLQRSGFDEDTRMLCWLPLFHDYGLVSGVLLPFMAGGRCEFYPTLAFLKDPLNWWTTASVRGSTHTCGPHFAYAASVRAMQAQPGWRADLSALRFVSCGAEPIHADTVRDWWRVTAPMGLRPNVFAPAYGMAETVLGLTGHVLTSGEPVRLIPLDAQALLDGRAVLRPEGEAEGDGKGDVDGVRTLVSCGPPGPGVELRIVCPETARVLGDGDVGEVWVRGGTVGQGYWGKPEQSERTFTARTADGDGPWLRTGDLGFLLDGELCITGRSKDLIIVRGRNVHPHDIEWTAARAHPACMGGVGAAFSFEGSAQGVLGEQLVLVHEVASDTPREALPGVAAEIRASIAEAHELPVHAVVLVRKGRLPRTSSGKVRRSQTRTDWLSGEVRDVWLDDRIGQSASDLSLTLTVPQDPVEARVLSIWQKVLGLTHIGCDTHFFELGGDSLTAAQVMARVSEHWRADWPVSWLFQHPTVAGLSAVIRQAEQGSAAAALPPMRRVARQAQRHEPVSLSQRRMWLVQQIDPTTTAYNIPIAVRMLGHFDADAWSAAFADLCQRHEAFRMRFEAQGGLPVQCHGPCTVPSIGWTDLGVWPAAERQQRLTAALREASFRVFDLTQPPLHRASIFRMGPDDHVVLWVLHHIIADHWAVTVLWREFAELYNARRQQRASRLPDKATDLVDHAHWQQEAVRGELLAQQLAHWRATLAGSQPVPLPTDRTWRVGQHLGGAAISHPLASGFVDELKAFSASRGATPYMVMLACLSMLMARHTQQDDVVVATPVANRRLVHAEGIVGTLVNTLPMRNQVVWANTFDAFLGAVRDGALRALAHQDIPFDHLVEQLGPTHAGGRLPLGIEVMLNVHNAPLGEVTFQDLDWTVLSFDRGSTQFPLAFAVDLEVGRHVSLEYATALFDADTASSWLAQLMGLVTQVMAAPARPLSSYTLMSDADLARLREWNDTERTVPLPWRADELVLQGLAGAQREVLRHPESGVGWDAEHLRARVSAIARALRAHGVSRGVRIGLFLERSADMPSSLLAAWRVGGTTLPLEPTLPPARLLDQAQDAGIALLLTQRALLPLTTWFEGPVLVLDDVVTKQGEPWPVDGGAADATPDDAAYIIYTSGSTGRPKGVEVSHRSLANFLRSMAREPGLTSDDSLLAVTTLSFDISLLEMLLPLMQGARLVLAGGEEVKDGARLKALVESEGITVLQATPSSWRLLMSAGWQGHAGIKALVGGEPLQRDLAERLLARTGELWNMYGPTETTVWSTCTRVRPEDVDQGIHIGRPIDNTQVWILDAESQPCPPGLPGEICIGGMGVALGYWQRPELTAERFVPDALGGLTGAARLYRTGDLGRWRHDGCIEHLGRMDGQVKLRGHRIELGEIEAVLAGHPGVRQCVANVVEVGPDDVRLCAHVVPAQQMPPAVALREFLRTKLPGYMIPQHFLAIESVPLLPNGKTHRRALPVLDAKVLNASAGSPPAQALTPTEQRIAAVWSTLLGLEHIEAIDNFFDLGGHSLLAARAVSAIEADLGVQVHPRQLVFESLRQTAAACDAQASTAGKRSA